MYLNNAYFGNGVWGVEDASKKYFGVSASEVSLDQAATLAGMLKGPELYNPLNSVEDSTNRRDTVLQNMVAAGYIDKTKKPKLLKLIWLRNCTISMKEKSQITVTPLILMRWLMKLFPSII